MATKLKTSRFDAAEYLKSEKDFAPFLKGRFWVGEVILKPRTTFASFQEVKPSAIAHIRELTGWGGEAQP